MDILELQELNDSELKLIEGGSKLSDAICNFFGWMFETPGIMATNGAAGHEIMNK